MRKLLTAYSVTKNVPFFVLFFKRMVFFYYSTKKMCSMFQIQTTALTITIQQRKESIFLKRNDLECLKIRILLQFDTRENEPFVEIFSLLLSFLFWCLYSFYLNVREAEVKWKSETRNTFFSSEREICRNYVKEQKTSYKSNITYTMVAKSPKFD